MKELKRIAFGVFFLCLLSLAAFSQSAWHMQPVPLQTRWAKDVSPSNALPDYPRPQMVRKQWQNLNGLWDYAITLKEAGKPAGFTGQILVPYPIESALSGIKKPLLPDQRLWYRRTFTHPALKSDERLLLHFGAVDWQANVYVNGKEVGIHKGGYQEFSFDITEALRASDNELVVRVWDPTDTGPNPRGKQVLNPERIFYTASSGIWQTVWLETVPAVSIDSFELTPDVDSGSLHVKVNTNKDAEGYTVIATATSGKKPVGSISGRLGEELTLSVPNAHLWSPTDPFLYDLSVQLLKNGKPVDTVQSYFGMRKIEIKKDASGIDRIFLNNKYVYNLGVLDQGFWPDGLYTAPTDAALRFDVEAIKAMGFNTIRKHIKIEPARWYYWSDKLGMLVWQDMPQPGNDSVEAKNEFEAESAANVKQLHNYPSIVAWVLFNEGWGAYDQERLTKWLKKSDPSRLINGHTGGGPGSWIASDITDIHAYPDPNIAPAEVGKARALGGFGGIGVAVERHEWDDTSGWGYIKKSPAELAITYGWMMKHLKLYEEEGLSGSIYTEPFDVETEENGLMTYDREIIKIPLTNLRKINESLVAATTAAEFNPATFPAKIADPVYPNLGYPALLKQYESGRRDPAFLRALAIMARDLKDKNNAAKLSAEYIATMRDPFTKDNIEFQSQFTEESMDRGFEFFYHNADRINTVMGSDYAQRVVASIITREEVDPILLLCSKSDEPATPNWNKISFNIENKYDRNYAERIILTAQVAFYKRVADWPEFASARERQIEKYPPKAGGGLAGDAWALNVDAWDVFLHCNDKSALSKALSWSDLSIRLWPDVSQSLDTKANLLYKLGRVEEAISWEEKAIEIDTIAAKRNGAEKGGLFDEYNATIVKMKKGEPTWPTSSP